MPPHKRPGHHPPPPPPDGPPHKRPGHHPPPPPPPNHKPPHERKKHSVGRLLMSVVIGAIVTTVIGSILFFLSIPITVVLPVAAPIFVGSITLAYTILVEKH